MRQTIVVIVSENERKSKPVIIAPRKLAVAISIVMSITEKRIVPKIPASKSERVGHTQSLASSSLNFRATPRSIARKPTATPNNIQRKGVVTATPDVRVRSATTTPITMLEITARLVQLHLHLH